MQILDKWHYQQQQHTCWYAEGISTTVSDCHFLSAADLKPSSLSSSPCAVYIVKKPNIKSCPRAHTEATATYPGCEFGSASRSLVILTQEPGDAQSCKSWPLSQRLLLWSDASLLLPDARSQLGRHFLEEELKFSWAVPRDRSVGYCK